jgi:protocatechuate 3,4-dioxygenase beta subunit
MSKTRPLLWAAAVVVAALVVFIWLRRGGEDGRTSGSAATPAAGATLPGAAAPRADGQRSAPSSPELDVLMDDDRAGTLRLEGQVVDETDAGVGGAVVRLDSNPPRQVTSEDDGSFAFDKLVGKPYTVVATSAAGAGGPVTVRLTATSDPVILRIRAAASLEVVVRSVADRAPIAGATVEVRGLFTESATTGADGVARIASVPAGGYQIAAWAKGYARATTWLGIGGAGIEREELMLKPGTGVSGRVVDAAGTPVAGARVFYSGVSDWSQQADPRFDAVLTDADGAFRIAALPPGTFRIVARHERFAPGQSEPITLDGTLDGTSERTGVEIRLGAGAVLAGVVVDKAGQPVGWASVRVAEKIAGVRFDRVRQAIADEAGRFELAALAQKPVDVVALHDRAQSAIVTVDLAATPDQRDVRLVLDVDGVIAGIVVDAQGGPVAGAQVSAWPDFRRDQARRRDWQLRGIPRELADAGGAFELTGLEPGNYLLGASPPGATGRGRGWMGEGEPAEVGDRNVRLVLEADGGVRGKVAFADGSAPEAFVVSPGGFRGGRPFSSRDGAFVLDELPPRTYQLTIRGPSFEQKAMGDVVVEAGKITDLGTITVRRGRTVSGRVVSAAGQPVPGASVIAGRVLFGTGTSTSAPGAMGPPGARRAKTAATDDYGEFTISGVGAGELALIAEHETQGRSTSITVPGSTESIVGVTLVLAAFGALEGTITIHGQPAENVLVNCQSKTAPMTMFGVASGPDGKFRFDRLAPDRYLVSAMSGTNPMQGFGFHSQSAEVVSNQTARVALTIDAGEVDLLVTPVAASGPVNYAQIFSARGKVTAKTAKQLQIELAGRDAGFSSFDMSFGGNPARIDGLAPADYTVCAMPYPAEVRGIQETLDYMEREGDKLPIFCKAVTVKARPKEQSIEVAVELPAYVPPPPEPNGS